MINELMQAATAMKTIVDLGSEDKLTSLPKGEVFHVRMANDGTIAKIEIIDAENAKSLKKFAPDKHKSFPAFNLSFVPSQDQFAREQQQIEASSFDAKKKAWIEYFGMGPKESKTILNDEDLKRVVEEKKWEFKTLWGNAKKVVKQNQSFANEIATLEGIEEGETIQKLLSIVGKLDAEDFINDFYGTIAAMKAFGRNRDGELSRGKKVSVFLDLQEYNEFQMASSESLDRLNAILCNGGTEERSEMVDCFGGDISGSDGLHNDITLPLLGSMKIRSANKDIPSLARYGAEASETHPMGNHSRIWASNALRWLAKPEYAGRTYGVVGEKELLFAYPTKLTNTPPMMAKLLGATGASEHVQEKFAKLSERVIQELRGIDKQDDVRELAIFAIRKVDKARTKVVYYRNLTVALLGRMARDWTLGTENLPDLDILDWPSTSGERREKKKVEKKVPLPVVPVSVYPARLRLFLNSCFAQSLMESSIKTFEPCEGIEIFLAEKPNSFTEYALSCFMNNMKGYFCDLCVNSVKHQVSKARDKPLFLAILGVLLYKNGIRKERYMNETAFLLGRFLRLADEVHRLYCEIVRDGNHPSEYCGGAALSTMQANPVATLEQLTQRLMPYVKWARAFHGKEKGGLVHSKLNQWGEIADALHEKGIPERLDLVGRVEVLLGYLAMSRKDNDLSNKDNKENANV